MLHPASYTYLTYWMFYLCLLLLTQVGSIISIYPSNLEIWYADYLWHSWSDIQPHLFGFHTAGQLLLAVATICVSEQYIITMSWLQHGMQCNNQMGFWIVIEHCLVWCTNVAWFNRFMTTAKGNIWVTIIAISVQHSGTHLLFEDPKIYQSFIHDMSEVTIILNSSI